MPGQVFHCLHIEVQEELKENRPVAGLLTIESGLCSVPKVVAKMKYLYEKFSKWGWKVKQVEQKKYVVEFPTKEARRELTRLKGFDFQLSNARANVRDTERTIDAFAELQEVWVKALGVPPLARSEKVMMKIAYLIGDPMEVDAISLNREAVRVKVLCRDPVKIGGTSEIFLNKVGYRITWNPEVSKSSYPNVPDDSKPNNSKEDRWRREDAYSQHSHEELSKDKPEEDKQKTEQSQREGSSYKKHKSNEDDSELNDLGEEGEKVDIPKYIPDFSDDLEDRESQREELREFRTEGSTEVGKNSKDNEFSQEKLPCEKEQPAAEVNLALMVLSFAEEVDGRNATDIDEGLTNKMAENDLEVTLLDQMEEDTKVLEEITGEAKDQDQKEEGFIVSASKKKKKQQRVVIAKRQSSRIIRDGFLVATKAQRRTSVKNDISGINSFAIFNTVEDDTLASIAKDAGTNLGNSEEEVIENIGTIRAKEEAQSILCLAKGKKAREDLVEKLPCTNEIEGCVSPQKLAAGRGPAKKGGGTKHKTKS